MYTSPYRFDVRESAHELKRLAALEEKIPSGYRLFSSIMHNDEQHKENLWNLEEALRCARIGHWYGMGHCFNLYSQSESQRLGTRLRLMEDDGIETYSSDPYCAQEHELYKELLMLFDAFWQTIGEHYHQLICTHNKRPSNEARSDIYQFRSNVSICQNVFSWLLRYYNLTEQAEQVAQAQLPPLVEVREPELVQVVLFD